ncbi:histidinol-phosphate transaminase [bacterium SCSIO 12741]|nr:histidinol-phosphate transaminase [bacterium SCSIO 12741]
MIEIPENITELKSYKPGKPIQEIIADLGLDKTAVLWNNENNFGPSPMALEEVSKVLGNSHVYPDPVSLELRKRIAELNQRQVDEVVVGNGSEEIFNNLFNAFFKPGEELLTCTGTFVAVYIWAKANKVPVHTVPLTSDYRFDPDALYQAITPKTKAIYLANPNNPTGAIIEEDELRSFLDKIPSHIIVVVDEAYFEFARDISPKYPDTSGWDYDNLITLRTFSKAYGIAAIRIGYALAKPALIEALAKVKLTFAPSNLAQAAGNGAIQDEAFLAKTIDNNTQEMEKFCASLDEMGFRHVPSYGNFVMLEMDSADQVQAYFHELLKKGVFVRPLPAFGLPHCLRITIGLPEENQLCVDALKECKVQLS